MLTDELTGENDSLGAVQKLRRLAKRPRVKRALLRLAALRKRKLAAKAKRFGKAAPTLAKKPVAKAIWARLSPAKKAAVVKKAVKTNPRLRKRLVAAIMAKKLAARQQGQLISPTTVAATPVPSLSPSTPAVAAPSRAAIPEEEGLTPAEAVEEEQMETPLEAAAEEESSTEEAGEKASEEVEEETAEREAEEETEELTEPSEEETEELAEEAASDAAEAAAESAGDLIVGMILRRRKARLRRDGKERICLIRAAPLARKIEAASAGEIKASHILGAAKIIVKAKGGNVKAKKGIKAVAKMAKRGAKPAKKALAKLKIANKVIKKTAPKKPPRTAKKGRKVPYTKPVTVRNAGLFSYSAHQRGMAMIPGFARAHYGS